MFFHPLVGYERFGSRLLLFLMRFAFAVFFFKLNRRIMPQMKKRKKNLQISVRERVMQVTTKTVKTLKSHKYRLKKHRRLGSSHVTLSLTLLTSALKVTVRNLNLLPQLQCLTNRPERRLRLSAWEQRANCLVILGSLGDLEHMKKRALVQ